MKAVECDYIGAVSVLDIDTCQTLDTRSSEVSVLYRK